MSVLQLSINNGTMRQQSVTSGDLPSLLPVSILSIISFDRECVFCIFVPLTHSVSYIIKSLYIFTEWDQSVFLKLVASVSL